MIFDSLANLKYYEPLHKYFKVVVQFIENTNLNNLEPGKIYFPDNCYANVDSYLTKKISDCFIECHKKYIDIQIIINGIEKIGICNKSECIENPYDEERDLQKLEGEVDFITLKQGYFAIFFPQDGHMPQVNHSNTSQLVKKIVFKIPVV